MAAHSNGLRGVVHGRTIQLNGESGLPDGQEVAVALQPIDQTQEWAAAMPPGEGLRRSAGAWADDAAALSTYLKWNRQQRKLSRRRMDP